MEFWKTLYDELIGFLGINQILETFRTGNYQHLLTLDGIISVISPLFPLLLLIEFVRAAVYKKFIIEGYKIPFMIYVFNRLIHDSFLLPRSRFVSGCSKDMLFSKQPLHGIGLFTDTLYGSFRILFIIFSGTRSDCSGACILLIMRRST